MKKGCPYCRCALRLQSYVIPNTCDVPTRSRCAENQVRTAPPTNFLSRNRLIDRKSLVGIYTLFWVQNVARGYRLLIDVEHQCVYLNMHIYFTVPIIQSDITMMPPMFVSSRFFQNRRDIHLFSRPVRKKKKRNEKKKSLPHDYGTNCFLFFDGPRTVDILRKR